MFGSIFLENYVFKTNGYVFFGMEVMGNFLKNVSF